MMFEKRAKDCDKRRGNIIWALKQINSVLLKV